MLLESEFDFTKIPISILLIAMVIFLIVFIILLVVALATGRKVSIWQIKIGSKVNSETKIPISKNEIKDSYQEKGVAEPKQQEQEVAKPTAEKKSMNDVFVLLKENKNADAEELFESIQVEEKQEATKNENKIFYWYYCGITGHANAVSELNKLISTLKDDELGSMGNLAVAEIYFKSKNYVEADKAYDLSLKYRDIEMRNKINFIGKARCIQMQESLEKAAEYCMSVINQLENNQLKAEVIQFISKEYAEEKKYFEAAIYNLKALEFAPNDTAVLFRAGYYFSEMGFETISVYFYDLVVSFDSNDSAAINNLGVSYERLNLKFAAIENYKKAHGQSNTLAASNLAYKAISSGFSEEANSFLSEAITKKNIHPNVWEAEEFLNKQIKEEELQLNELRKNSEWQTRFFKLYGESFLKKESMQKDFSDKWVLTGVGDVETLISENTVIFSITSKGAFKDSLELQFNGNIATAIFYEKHETVDFVMSTFEGYGLYIEAKNTILAVAQLNNIVKSFEFVKLKPKALTT